MAGVDVGTAYLTVVPSAKGFAGKLQAELGSGMSAAGSKAGNTAGKSFGASYGAGIKNAAKAGGLALVAAGAAAIAFGRDAVAEARESQKVGATTTAIIKATGGAAKITAGQVGDLATAISNKTGMDDETIQSGANMLLTFKNVRNEVGKGAQIFDRATTAAADLSAAGFGDVKGASVLLGKALNDPIKGITALGRSGVTFTQQQKDQIKTLVASGKTLDAQKLILKEVEGQVGGTAAASATMGEKMSTAFGNFKEQVGTALLPYLDKAEKLIVDKVIPAVSKFFTEMQNGTGKGGEFVAFLKDVGEKLAAVAGFIQRNSDVIVPFVVAIGSAVAIIKTITAVAKAYTAVQAALNVVLTANPIGLVVVAIALLVAGLVVAYKKSEKFRTVVDLAFKGIGMAATWLWNKVLAPVIRWIVDGFAKVALGIAYFLQQLGNVPGFGWAKAAGDKMAAAAGKARELAKSIKDIPARKVINVDIYARTRQTGRIELPNGQSVNVGMREHGGPVRAGQPYIVGERRPELFVPSSNGRIVPQVPTGGGGLSQADVLRIAGAMSQVQLQTTVSAGSFDRQMGARL